MKFFSVILMAAGVSLAATSSHAANVTIDDFAGPLQTVVAPNPVTAANPDSTPGTASGSVVGLSRFIGAFRTSAAGSTIGFSNGSFAGVANSADADGFSQFVWLPLSPINLVDGTNDRLSLDVLGVTAPAGVPVSATYAFTVTDSFGMDATLSQAVSGPTTLDFSFAPFAGVDFTSVSNITLLVTGAPGFGTTFDNVRATGPAVVPLPAGGLLLLSGLVGVGLMRRRRTRA